MFEEQENVKDVTIQLNIITKLDYRALYASYDY